MQPIWRDIWYSTERYRLPFHRRGWTDGNLVSILLPTHNRAELLGARAIRSVLAQTHQDWELLVLAHGCTDDTLSLANWHSKRNPRVRVYSIPRIKHFPDTPEGQWLAGPVDPLNIGLSDVRGQWIARLDDDDIWLPRHLEDSLSYARDQGIDFSSAMTENHRGIVKPYDVDGVDVGAVQTWVYKSYLKFMRYNRDCWMKRWDRVNDTDLQTRMRAAGVKMGYLARIHCRILPRPGETEVGSRAL